MKDDIIQEYRELKEDLAFNPDIMCEDDDRLRAVKYILDNCISTEEKTLLLLYTKYQSYRKLGEKLKVSHMTCRRYVIRAKQKILEEYRKRNSTR